MKVILDAMGGDNAPEQIVLGAVEAVNENKELTVIITGKQELIEAELSKYTFDKTRIEIVNCTEVITNNESPATAIRVKKDSSLSVAMDKLKKEDDIIALVSAGSTGAVLSGGLLKVGRIKGISRPAICAVLPKVVGNVVLLDCGANAECKPINMCHFAILGSSYAKAMLGVDNPKVALLNNGAEEHKGDELHQTTYQLLSKMEGINFVGNVEGRDIMLSNCDVIVADGFSGNVALKSIEGTAIGLLKILKSSIKASSSAKFGYLFMKKAFKNVIKQMDYNEYGGAVIIGCEKLIIKAHGSSEAVTIKNAILRAIEAHKANLITNIKDLLKNINLDDIEGIEK